MLFQHFRLHEKGPSMYMDDLVAQITEYQTGTVMIVEWEGKVKIRGIFDTAYETNNGFYDDDRFQEFYAVLLLVTEIIYCTHDEYAIKIDSYHEISMENPPTRVELDNGTIIWHA